MPFLSSCPLLAHCSAITSALQRGSALTLRCISYASLLALRRLDKCLYSSNPMQSTAARRPCQASHPSLHGLQLHASHGCGPASGWTICFRRSFRGCRVYCFITSSNRKAPEDKLPSDAAPAARCIDFAKPEVHCSAASALARISARPLSRCCSRLQFHFRHGRFPPQGLPPFSLRNLQRKQSILLPHICALHFGHCQSGGRQTAEV